MKTVSALMPKTEKGNRASSRNAAQDCTPKT